LFSETLAWSSVALFQVFAAVSEFVMMGDYSSDK